MINKIAHLIVNWQIQREYISVDKKENLIYAYHVLIVYMLNLVIAFTIATVLRQQSSMLLFILLFAPVRIYAGGFHAKNDGRCMFLSAIVELFVALANKYYYWLHFGDINDLFFLGILFICIIILAPIEAENKTVSKTEKQKYKFITFLVCLLEVVFSYILWINKENSCVLYNVFLSLMVESILLCTGM